MRPKKAKEFVKPTADELELSEALVEAVSSFYWASVQKALSNLEGAFISVTNLGTFAVKPNVIKKIQVKYTRYLDDVEPNAMTFNKHSIKNTAEFKLERLKEIEKQFEEEKLRKREVKQKRKEYVDSKALEK